MMQRLCIGERILIVAIGTGICHEGNSCHGDRILQRVYVREAHHCKKNGCLGDSKMNIGFQVSTIPHWEWAQDYGICPIA